MATFDFPLHRQRTKYPDSSVRMQFGSGYVAAAEPQAPDQRIFVLSFTGMRYITTTPTGTTLDLTSDPYKNYGKLEKFYQDHRLYTTFTYVHPVYGSLTCRFNKPLEGPEGIPGGTGVVKDFELELIEVL